MPTNGRLNLSTLTLVDGWACLEPATARAWIAACDELVELGHTRPTITNPDGAYRDYAGQVRMKTYWTEQGIPLNAATPGTSNHGLGTCVDIYEVWRWPRKVLVEVMGRHGFVFDYPPEAWHAHRTSINPADNGIATASLGLEPIEIEQKEDDEMRVYQISDGGLKGTIWGLAPGAMFNAKDGADGLLMGSVLNPDGKLIPKTEKELRTIAGYLGVPDNLIGAASAGVNWSWAKDAMTLAKTGGTTGSGPTAAQIAAELVKLIPAAPTKLSGTLS